MKKKTKIIILIAIIIFLFIIFSIIYINRCKILKNGYNKNSQEIVESILNISSYEAIVEIKIEGNKNQNEYKIKQKYLGPENNFQEIIEPENISGIKISREANKLVLENSKLDLKTIIENYSYISENKLDLSSFIEDYKKDRKAKYVEDDEIIMETNYSLKKTLYINKNTGKPIKMIVEDDIKNNKIYILYNEVDIK